MKKNNLFLTAIGFLSGIVLTISVMGLLAFSSEPVPPGSGTGIIPITAAVANTYFKNYMAGATSVNQVIKGFTLDKKQLEAMNNIARENPALPGFRIYMGRNNSAQQISIVVGVSSDGRDATTNTIYYTDSQTNPCPPVCDAISPIIKD